jgi:hypothetical protein
VQAKGWRFELDHERIERSDTWALAPAELRPWLLMLWMMAWRQEPCGSLPNDDELIAVRIGMPLETFMKVRAKLMRGWWLAEDGRLYHDTLVLRVLEMITKRRSEADRKARNRAKPDGEVGGNSPDVPRDSGGTEPGLPRESDTRTRTSTSNTSVPDGTDTGTAAPNPPRKRRGAAPPAQLVTVEDLVAAGVKQQHAEDWLTVRAKKNLPLTPTAWSDVQNQATQAGLSVGEAVRQATVNGWGGFKSSWLSRGADPPGQRQQGVRATKFTAAAADIFGSSKDPEVIDAQAIRRH